MALRSWWRERFGGGWIAIALLGLGAAFAAAAVPSGRALLSSAGPSGGPASGLADTADGSDAFRRAPATVARSGSPVRSTDVGAADGNWAGDVVIADPLEEERLEIMRTAVLGSRRLPAAHDEAAIGERSGLLVLPAVTRGEFSDAEPADDDAVIAGRARNVTAEGTCNDGLEALSEAALLACPFTAPSTSRLGEAGLLRTPAALELPRPL